MAATKTRLTDLLNRHKVPYIYMSVKFNADGSKCKDSVKRQTPKGWTKWKYERCMTYNQDKQNELHINVNLSKSCFMVIDNDEKSVDSKFRDAFGQELMTSSISKNCAHAWFKKDHDDRSKDLTDAYANDAEVIKFSPYLIKTDLRYSNIFESKDAMIDIPQDFRVFDFKHEHPSPISAKTEEKNNRQQQYDEEVYNHDKTNILGNFEKMTRLGLLDKNLETYNSWFQLMCAVKRCNIHYIHWDELCQRCPSNYNALKNFDDWEALDVSASGFNYASLHKWCKENDPELYNANFTKPFIIVGSEQDVLNYLHKHHKNDIRRGVDGFYVANKNQLFYTKGEDGLRVLVKTIDFRKQTKDDIKPWSATTKGMEDIIKYINKNSNDIFPVDEKFIEKVNIYTTGKMHFQNGYYLDTTGAFHKTPKDQLPINVFKRDAPPEFSDFTAEMKQNYLNQFWNMFTEDQSKVVLKMISRAMFGYRDKNWTVFNGLRDAGKGVGEKGIKHSIGDYCGTMDLPMTKTQHSGDASQYRFILSAGLHQKRIAFTNEATSIVGKKLKIDGNAIKKFVSGGDEVMCRGLYKDEVSVVFNAHIFANVNSIPESDPADAMMTCLPIKMPYKFVADPTDICERMCDTDIKKKIELQDPNLFLSILVDHFTEHALTTKDLTANDNDEFADNVMRSATEAPYIFKTKFVADKNAWISTNMLRQIFAPSELNDITLGKFLTQRMKPMRKWTMNGTERVRVCGYAGFRLIEECETYNDEGEDIDSISSVDDM